MQGAAGKFHAAAGRFLRRLACLRRGLPLLAAAAIAATAVPATAQVPSRTIRNIASVTYSTLAVPVKSNETLLEVALPQYSVSLRTSTPTAPPGQTVTFTARVDNRGGAAAPAVAAYTLDGVASTAGFVLIRVPADADFAAAGGMSFYHYAGRPAGEFRSGAPAAGKVDAVGMLLAQVPASGSAEYSLQLVARNVAAVYGSGVVLEMGAGVGADGGTASWLQAGTPARTQVVAAPVALKVYADQAATLPARAVYVGNSAWLRLEAQACNMDPNAVDVRTARVTTSDGDTERIVATETGPATGVFQLQRLPTRHGAPQPASDHLESPAGATVTVTVDGCFAPITANFQLIDPRGTVFDSSSNEPLDGMTVSLLVAQGGACTGSLANVLAEDDAGQLVASPNPFRTANGGRFEFPLVAAGSYCLKVQSTPDYTFPSAKPLSAMPAGRVLAAGGAANPSLGAPFPVGPAPEPVVLDLPMDPTGSQPLTLFVAKKPSRGVVLVGEQLDFTVTVRNVGDKRVSAIQLRDVMSPGLSLMPGTVRVNGANVAESPSGARLTRVALPDLDPGQTHTVTYRTAVTTSAGDDVRNAAFAAGRGGQSNTAEVKVQVRRGFETDNKGVLTGTVYLACGRESAVGMPGVRLLLEDGTSVLTDGRGRFSRYGLRPGTHALKLDPASLPDGVRLAPGARPLDFVDLKDGELFKRDIALECSPAAQVAAQARARTAPDEEVFRSIDRNFTATVPAPVLAGVVGPVTSSGVVAPAAAAQPRSAPPAAAASAPAPAPAAPGAAPAAAAAAETGQPSALEAALLASADNKAAFLNLADGQVLPTSVTAIQVKAPAESRLELTVNGEAVPPTRIGQRSLYAEKAMMGLEFVAVQLKPGANEIRLAQKDQFGNARGTAVVHVTAPGELAQISLSPVAEGFYSGEAGQALVRIRLLDAAGIPVTARLPVTLSTDLGQWLVPGTLEADGAVRVFVEGGQAEVAITQPAQAMRVNVTAASGGVVHRQTLDFVPRARPFIAAGVAEGIVRLRSGQAMRVAPTTSLDAFSRELQGVSRDFGQGQVGARAAVYLKGKVKGDYLLTLAYDSDKQTRDRLFRDISPDEFYPIYGDDSTRAFDAQSTSRLYVRVEKGHSWLLVGDFNTEFAAASGVKPTLSAYNRPVTGAATHVEAGPVAVDAFVTRDRTRQQVAEIAANGTSGPYTIGVTDLVPNSERVEIVVRDRLNLQVELRRTTLTRLQDYEIEELSGRILLRSPLFAFDAEGNPVFLRVSFEVDTNQAAFTTAGAQVTARVAERTTAAVRMVREGNPAAPYTLQGAIVQSQVGPNLQVTTELARSERGGATPASGTAARVEAKGAVGPVELNAVVTSTGSGFDNTSSGVSPGRLDATASASLRIADNLKIVGKLAEGRDRRTQAHQEVAYAGVEATPLPGLTVEAGLRSLKDTGAVATAAAAQQTDVTTVRAKASLQPQSLPELTAFVEAEQALEDSSQHLLAGGVSYQLGSGTKLYARHELVNTLPVLSSAATSHQKTALGFETAYRTGGRFYGELRDTAGQGLSLPAAAFGVKDSWEPLQGVRLAAGLERVQALRNAPAGATLPTGGDSLAVTTSVQLNLAERWRAHARVEVSRGDTEDTLLVGSGLAYKLSDAWTLLARQAFFRSERTTAPRLQITSRMQLGSAWRSVGRDALFVAESVREPVAEGGTRESGVVSVQYGQDAGDKLRFSTRLAARSSRENTMGMATRSHAAVAGLRASWQVDRQWNVAAQTLVLAGAGTRSLGFGVEAGYRFADNLWLVVGYNFMEARDPVLARDDFSRGLYFRVRYLFDETALDGMVN
ncbi:hypothetical protein [Ramlibacter sp. AN1133]|uniref:hypothetical protein n=1 Tax=Ramlibacter sp. AN1133 TaxID=3133429 RepID=UPI0030C0F47A